MLAVKDKRFKMTKEELREACALEKVTAFLEPSCIFDREIIGITPNCFHVIYNYEKIVEGFMEIEKWTEEEALKWIDFNTIPCLHLMGVGYPIIMFPLFDENQKVA